MEIFVRDYVTRIFFKKKNSFKNHEQHTMKQTFFTTEPTVTVRQVRLHRKYRTEML